MKMLKHATAQPFIFATGLAALVHSTWSLAVLFSGEPPLWEPTSLASWARWVYWLVPALLIAFALDVGQIATSTEIRDGERTPTKYTTFMVFAVATYYLQWLYIAHHMPALELGAGVYSDGLAGRLVLLTRNAAIWFIPALLPLSTTMYTLSGGSHTHNAPVVTEQREVNVVVDDLETNLLPDGGPDGHYIECPECGWHKVYDNADSAQRGLRAHRQHCTVLHPELTEQYHEGAANE
jgi:hypothetical protein